MTNRQACGFFSLENMDDLKKCVQTSHLDILGDFLVPAKAIMSGCVLTSQLVSMIYSWPP